MGYLGNTPALSYTSFAVQHFTTSATTSYTLDHSVANENEIRLVINNVVQQPGSSYAYTASGTTLTLSAATSATDTMYAVFLGKAVQTVTPATGTVTNAMLAGSIDLTSKVTGTLPVANGGTNLSSGFANGITMLDQWRLTSALSLSGNATTAITANLERNDTSGFAQIGTGMTESSGVFTFPSTGIYEIYAFGNFYGGLDIAFCRVEIRTSSDNFSSDDTLQNAGNAHTFNGYYAMAPAYAVFDVTNTSTHKVKFNARHGNSGSLLGSTSNNTTLFSFKRIGDT